MSSPVLTILVERLSDLCTEAEATALAIPTLAGVEDAACDEATEQRRAFRCSDIACRVWAPRSLRATGIPDLIERAETLAALAPVVDRPSARVAYRDAYGAVAGAAARFPSCAAAWSAESAAWSAEDAEATWAAKAAIWAAEAASWTASWAATEADRAATLTELRDLIHELVAMEVPS